MTSVSDKAVTSAKTRKLDNTTSASRNEVDPTIKKHKKVSTRNYILCIPNTVISSGNCKSLDQITLVAYQIAKNATIYNVSEIIILNVPDTSECQVNQETKLKGAVKDGNKIKFDNSTDDKNQSAEKKDSNKINEETMILATLLQYFITPPYLVKSIFKDTKYLKCVKNYPTLTTLPFMKTNFADSPIRSNFREGLSISEKSSMPKEKHIPGSKVKKSKKRKEHLLMTSYVNCGLAEPVKLQKNEKIPVNVRVTMDIKNKKIVSPLDAYYADTIGAKVSVGYHVRVAKSFSSIFTESAFPEGYTGAIFMESGNYFNNKSQVEYKKKKREVPKLQSLDHLHEKNGDTNLLVFTGKEADFELSFKDDENLKEVEDIGEFFNYNLDLNLPFVRSEDAILIALTKIETI